MAATTAAAAAATAAAAAAATTTTTTTSSSSSSYAPSGYLQRAPVYPTRQLQHVNQPIHTPRLQSQAPTHAFQILLIPLKHRYLLRCRRLRHIHKQILVPFPLPLSQRPCVIPPLAPPLSVVVSFTSTSTLPSSAYHHSGFRAANTLCMWLGVGACFRLLLLHRNRGLAPRLKRP